MAVYTTVDDLALATFLSAYDLGDVLSFAGIAEGVENSNYLLRTTKAHYILTLFEKRVNADDLPFFMHLMTHLASKGMNCPLPVAAHDGSILRELKGRPCAIFSFLDGTSSRYPNREKCKALGQSLADCTLMQQALIVTGKMRLDQYHGNHFLIVLASAPMKLFRKCKIWPKND